MDSGYDNITGPGINQWDMSLYKNVSIREKARIQLRLEAFNAFNHTEWGGLNSTILFDSAGTVKNLPSQLGGGGGRVGFGAHTRLHSTTHLEPSLSLLLRFLPVLPFRFNSRVPA